MPIACLGTNPIGDTSRFSPPMNASVPPLTYLGIGSTASEASAKGVCSPVSLSQSTTPASPTQGAKNFFAGPKSMNGIPLFEGPHSCSESGSQFQSLGPEKGPHLNCSASGIPTSLALAAIKASLSLAACVGTVVSKPKPSRTPGAIPSP